MFSLFLIFFNKIYNLTKYYMCYHCLFVFLGYLAGYKFLVLHHTCTKFKMNQHKTDIKPIYCYFSKLKTFFIWYIHLLV